MTAVEKTLKPLSAEQRSQFKWLQAPHLKSVVAALEAAEKDAARFVGGCVRDSLLGAEPKDFDLATTLEPEQVLAALKAANIRAVPTGIDHGTVTAIVDHQGVEITTLRADVSTDGRRATVAFTRDWTQDSCRRDFRLNAIYLTPDGHLFDPVEGVGDAQAKRIRFIGDAQERIREDYLRILRFFRFSARFSEKFDEDGLNACVALKEGIAMLSAERIGAELLATLQLPRASFAVDAMARTGILNEIWSAPVNVSSVERLKSLVPSATGPIVLAAAYGEQGDGIGGRLRLSNAEKSLRSNAIAAAKLIDGAADERQARMQIYKLGKDGFCDGLLLAFATDKIARNDYDRLLAIADQWMPPKLRITGRHAVSLGIAPGPDVTKILDAVEAQWIAEDFPEGERLDVILSEQVAKLAAHKSN